MSHEKSITEFAVHRTERYIFEIDSLPLPRIVMPTQVVTHQRGHRKLVGVVPKGGGAELRCPFLPVTKFEVQSSGIQPLGILLSVLIKVAMA